jgi:hypothetical protein
VPLANNASGPSPSINIQQSVVIYFS